MSKRKSSVRSGKNTKVKAVPLSPRLREVELIATALANLPTLDRKTQNSESYPYNEIASSEPMQKLVTKLVLERYPDNAWNAVHPAMCKTDRTGRGYWTWTDAFRDASFQCGVEYAMRSLPDWLPLLRLIAPDTLEDLGMFVRRIAENSLESVLDNEQRTAVGLLMRDVGDHGGAR